jgi:hypothetical protein
MSDQSYGYMTAMESQCPSCGGTYEHDEDCALGRSQSHSPPVSAWKRPVAR